MNPIGRAQDVFTRIIRPAANIRGFGRVCRMANRGFLNAGVPPIQIARMHDGSRMWLDLRSQTEWSAYYSGRYDEAAIGLIQKILTHLEGDFLDIGGNIGMYAIRIAAALGPDRKVLCFEPMPTNVERIRLNAILNQVEDRVLVYEMALSDSEGQTDLVLREDFERGSVTGNASIAISREADGDFKKIRVPIRTFDALRAEMDWGKIPVAKVDIEGHEDFFLRGASSWLSKDRPIIFTEINNWFYQKRGTNSSYVFSESLPKDYSVSLIHCRNNICQLQPFKISDLSSLLYVENCVMYPTERSADLLQASG